MAAFASRCSRRGSSVKSRLSIWSLSFMTAIRLRKLALRRLSSVNGKKGSDHRFGRRTENVRQKNKKPRYLFSIFLSYIFLSDTFYLLQRTLGGFLPPTPESWRQRPGKEGDTKIFLRHSVCS